MTPTPSLAQLATLYMARQTGTGTLAANSARVELVRLRSLPGWHHHAAALDAQAVDAWTYTLHRFSPSSRRAYVGAVRRYLRWLALNGHTPTDLSSRLPKVREPRGVPRALSAPAVASITNTRATSRVAWLPAAVALMVGCGLRCVEVSRLDVDDYNPSSRTVHVVGKGGHQRVLPVPADTARALHEWTASHPATSGPFLVGVRSPQSPDGRLSPAWISKRTARLMASAGVHTAGDGRSAHSLRHTAASDVLDRCHDLRVVQQMLGHQSLATTERYLRIADLGRMRDAMEGRSYAA